MSRFVDPSTLDIYDRLSRPNITRHEHAAEFQRRASSSLVDSELDIDASTDAQSPSSTGSGSPIKHGTSSSPSASASVSEDIAKRDAISWCDRRWCGLVVHNIAIAIVSTALPVTVFPFFMAYLNVEGTQALSARALLAAPWALKPLFVMLTDCVPLVPRSHRRAFLMLGWLICALALGAIYFFPIPDPFFRDRQLVGIPLNKMTPAQLATITLDAPSYAARYVMFMTVATTGYVLADVAADALTRQLVRTHFPVPGEAGASALETTMTQMRYLFMLTSFLFMGIGLNGTDYGGDFRFTLGFNTLMLVLGAVAFTPIPVALIMIAEPPRTRRSLRVSVHELWGLLQNRAINYVLACRFLSGIFSGISATAVNPIAFYWAHVQPINDNAVKFLAMGFVLGALQLADTRGWTINFRLTIILANIFMLVADSGPALCTIWDVVRSQWFWIGLPLMEALPSALDYVIVTILVAELADPGTEQTMRGLVPAVAFLADLFGLALTKFIDGQFRLSNQDIMSDTTPVRWDATVVFAIAYICQLLSLAWLLALPRHASDVREWKKRSGSSRVLGVVLLALMLWCAAWGVSEHVWSVAQPAWCLRIAGGDGCE